MSEPTGARFGLLAAPLPREHSPTGTNEFGRTISVPISLVPILGFTVLVQLRWRGLEAKDRWKPSRTVTSRGAQVWSRSYGRSGGAWQRRLSHPCGFVSISRFLRFLLTLRAFHFEVREETERIAGRLASDVKRSRKGDADADDPAH